MEIVSNLGLIYLSVFLLWALISRGVPVFQELIHDMTDFFMEKALGPGADLFEGREGSGPVSWMMHGMLWFCIGATFSFLGLWMAHEPNAISSLSSIGYGPSAATVAAVGKAALGGGLLMLLIGAGLQINGRLSGSGVASDTNAILVSWTFSLGLLMAFIAGHLGESDFAGILDTIAAVLSFMPIVAVFANHLLTIGNRGANALQASQWLIIFGLGMMILATVAEFFGCLGATTLESLETTGILSAALAVAFYVVPTEAGVPLWSRSLAGATVLLTFITLSPIGVAGAGSVTTGGAALLTVIYAASMIPILAAAMNVFQTARANWSAAAESPASSAVMLGMFMLVGAAIGSLFTGADAHSDGELSHLVTPMGLLFSGAISLIAIGGVMRCFPSASGRKLFSEESSRLTVWMIAGGTTLTFLFSLSAAMLNAAFDAAVAANDWDADLIDTGAVNELTTLASIAFYFVVIASILMMLNMIRGVFNGAALGTDGPTGLAARGMALTPGTTTIRQLLSAGAGVDTEIDVVCDTCGDEEE